MSGDSPAARNAPVADDDSTDLTSAAFAESSQRSRGAVASPQRIVRPPDRRPRHALERLEELGVRTITSERLILHTDVPEGPVDEIPTAVDALFEALEAWFGQLPPAADKSEFQMTGYILRDRALFEKAGMLSPEIIFVNGRHRGLEFWMNDQPTDYYRQHLALHEATHCFMTVLPNPLLSARWYMEGMAEYFATHRVQRSGAYEFGVFPDQTENFPGLARIRMIRDDVRAHGVKTWDDLLDMPVLSEDNTAYAWSWASCALLANHPRYREKFRTIEHHVRADTWKADLQRAYASQWTDLRDEWLQFANNVCHGFDVPRSVIDFEPGKSLDGGPSRLRVAADRGWQCSRVRVEAGQRYAVRAQGRFQLGDSPQPWISEPQGVSLRYHAGRPLGELVGCIRPDPREPDRASFLVVIPLGRSAELRPQHSGTLYLRLNDAWNELADNTGEVEVEIVKRDAAVEEGQP